MKTALAIYLSCPRHMARQKITSDLNMPISNVWHWRLPPDYETKIYNYPKHPIEKILWKPGEEARMRARGSVHSVILQQTKKNTKSRWRRGCVEEYRN